MSDQYVGEIRMFSGDYAPHGWHLCDGSLLNTSEYELLFSLLGVTYGGDGITNFRLPDLRGRIPIHRSSEYSLGQMGGTETVTLNEAQLPEHTHIANANSLSQETKETTPAGNFWGQSTSYQSGSPNVLMHKHTVSSVGGSKPHNNMMPSLTVNFIIALNGMYPSQA